MLIEDDNGIRTVVGCQASWNSGGFMGQTLGNDGWDQDAGTASCSSTVCGTVGADESGDPAGSEFEPG